VKYQFSKIAPTESTATADQAHMHCNRMLLQEMSGHQANKTSHKIIIQQKNSRIWCCMSYFSLQSWFEVFKEMTSKELTETNCHVRLSCSKQ